MKIYENHFGKKLKYHRGQLKTKVDIWVVRLVERGKGGRQLLYPVESRKRDTLLKIIKRHVEPGSTIYTDRRSSYRNLNENGLTHFSVIHQDSYVKEYRNSTTGEIIQVDTNTIEGSWQGPKEHFKMRHRCGTSTFEAHLAEIIRQNHHHGSPGDVYEQFFLLLNSIYKYGPQ